MILQAAFYEPKTLVVTGPQGSGKSKLAQALGWREYSLDTALRLPLAPRDGAVFTSQQYDLDVCFAILRKLDEQGAAAKAFGP